MVIVAGYGERERGRKLATSDPDLGNWSYSDNTLGQLVSQTDAKGQVNSLLVGIRVGDRLERDCTASQPVQSLEISPTMSALCNYAGH